MAFAISFKENVQKKILYKFIHTAIIHSRIQKI